MKNLYQTMSDYFKNNPMDWNYYLNELELPKNINDARNFIKDFFAYGGKSYLIHDIIQECEPLTKSSLAPIRVNILSNIGILASLQGTKLPSCAIITTIASVLI